MFEIGDVAAEHNELIIVASRHEEAAHHRGALGDRALESLEVLLALRFETDADENGHRKTEPLVIERGMIAGDDSAFLESLQAPGAGGA
jgi:hypothetical protein